MQFWKLLLMMLLMNISFSVRATGKRFYFLVSLDIMLTKNILQKLQRFLISLSTIKSV